LVLLVETPEGRYLNAAGAANLEDGTPMRADDILEIGSNTKSMTVVLLMQLVEEGLISLDDPLSKWLPEQAASLPNGDQITLRQMANHTAGLWDYGDDIIGGGVDDPAKLEKTYTPEELVQYAVENGEPYFTPGQEGMWKYSNTGYVLLGMVIEKVTGKSVSELYRTRIFDPLGMESATFIEGVPGDGEITTHGYWWTEDGRRVDTTNWNASQGWAAGAAAMTAADLATYAKGLAAGKLFKNPETLKEMLTFNPAAKYSVGGPYGLGLIDFSGDGKVWGHGGQTLGFQSLWYTDPESGIVVVGLTNSAAYKADAFVNVLNILKGGALPLNAFTLLPIGSLIPTKWEWVQFSNPAETTDVDASTGLKLAITKDQSVTVESSDCGQASGSYTVDAGNIDFQIDPSTLTCDANSPAGKFVQYLNDAVKWHFDNGGLVIELPADGGTLVFKNVKE
jgi:D-alanyl-D-alanine carboxypeptidase